MRRRRSWWSRHGRLAVGVSAVVLVAAVVIAGISLSPARPARPVVVSTAVWAPYVTDEEGHGPAVEVVREVLEGLGYAPTAETSSWDRALADVRAGKSLAAFPLVASEERRDEFLVSRPLLEFDYVLFRDAGAGEGPQSLADLARLRVAGVEGYDYWPELDEAVGEYQRFPTGADAFRALADGKVDLVAEGAVAGRAIVGDPEFAVDAARFVEVEGDWARSTQQLHAMVARTKAGAEFLDSFDAALEAHRATPEYAATVAGLEGPALDRIVLRGQSATVALEIADGDVVHVPRGSEAVALSWPELLSEGSRVQVKVTSGPASGRMGTVSVEDVEVAP